MLRYIYIYIYLFYRVLDSDAIIYTIIIMIIIVIVANLVLLKCYWSRRGTKEHIMIDIPKGMILLIYTSTIAGRVLGWDSSAGGYRVQTVLHISVGCGFDVNNNITIVHPSTYVLPVHASRRRDTCTACSPQCVK